MSILDLTFIRAEWLWLLPVCWSMAWRMTRHQTTGGAWSAVVDPHLLQFLAGDSDDKRPSRLAWWWLLFSTLGLIAAAGPALEKQEIPVFSNQDPVVLVADLSASMRSDDLAPSRLQQLQYKLADMLDAREEGQTALVVFAGDAFTVTPLTDDVETIRALLPALSPDIMPSSGGCLRCGLVMAADLLAQAGFLQGRIIAMTDHADDADVLQASDLRQRGYQVSVIAVGTDNPKPIPSSQSGFLKDDQGNIVIAEVPVEKLDQVASAGGGAFLRLNSGAVSVQPLAAGELQALDTESENQTTTAYWRDLGPYGVFLLVPLAVLIFRRGWIWLLVVAILPIAPQAQAGWWQDLWQRPDQQAHQALTSGDVAKAVALAQDPMTRAAAQYRGESFESAAGGFAEVDSVTGHYNRGNALAQTGQLEAAIAAYEQALTQDPEHEDAQFNKKLVEQMLDQQQQQEQQDQQQQDQQQQQNSDEQQDSSSDSEESQSESESSEQQSAGEEEAEQNQQEQQEASEQQSEEQPISEEQMEAEAFDAEQQQAIEQWLGRIPDDPGGLLRRKFLMQYRERQQERGEQEDY